MKPQKGELETVTIAAAAIPLVDLLAQHEEVRDEIDAAFRDIIQKSSFIGGPYVDRFEQDYAAYCGSRHAVGCASGTDALRLALLAAGVQPGDEVITTPLTFIATVEAISQIGAHPSFVDVDPKTYTLDPARLSIFLETECRVDDAGRPRHVKTGRRVTAIVPVHLYGLPADMTPVMRLAQQHHLIVVEDACQAHGALHFDKSAAPAPRKAGTIGVAGCFSFYPGKNLGAMGEAGAAITDDDDIAARMRMYRDHGQRERYMHMSPLGWNGRLDALQAAVLSIKLRRLDDWNARRRQVAAWYDARLTVLGIAPPIEPDYARHVYHLYVVRVDERDRVLSALNAQRISAGVHYPIPLHLQEAYAALGHRAGDFPHAEACARAVLSLPMHPHLTEGEVEYICRQLRGVASVTN